MITIGRYIQQKGNYRAFIPGQFPPKGLPYNELKIIKLLSDANLLLGKLDFIEGIKDKVQVVLFTYLAPSLL